MPESLSWFAIFAITTVSWGGLLFGYDIGIITSTIDATKDDIPMTPIQEGLVMSLIGAGSIFGAIIAGPMCDTLGRWKSIHIQNICFILGALLTCTAQSLDSLYLGRFVIGIAAAISAIADVPYLLEISPLHLRGTITCTYEVMVSVGVLLSFLLGLVLYSNSNGWRIAYLIPVFFCIIQSCLMFWLPESPKWLLSRKRTNEVRTALLLIYGQAALENWLELVGRQYKADKRAREMKYAMEREERGGDDDNASANGGSSNGGASSDKDDKEGEGGGGEKVGDTHPPLEVPPDIRHYYQLLVEDHSSGSTRGSNIPPATAALPPNTSISSTSTREEGPPQEGLAPSQREHTAVPTHSCSGCLLDCLPSLYRPAVLSLAKEMAVMQEYALLIIYVIFIQTMTQFTGGVVVRNYATSLMLQAGMSSAAALQFTCGMGAVKLVFTLGTVYYIERVGRRALFQYGIGIVSLGMFVLIIASIITLLSPESGDSGTQDVSGWLFGIALVVGGYGVAYGPLPWILSSEPFPVLIRGKVMAISLIAQNVSLLVTNLVFLLMIDDMTAVGTFTFFLIMNGVTALWVHLLLVETTDLPPAEILMQTRTAYRQNLSLYCGEKRDYGRGGGRRSDGVYADVYSNIRIEERKSDQRGGQGQGQGQVEMGREMGREMEMVALPQDSPLREGRMQA